MQCKRTWGPERSLARVAFCFTVEEIAVNNVELKPALKIENQLARLKVRGMNIEDDAEAAAVLQRMNYYRITGYAFLFQKNNEKYRRGTSFKRIMRLMEFDAALRRALLEQLEYIEIYARTEIAYWFSMAHDMDGGAHYNDTYFESAERHKEYIENLQRQMRMNDKQPLVAHHIQKFGGKMPIWCAVEILSFSTLSKLYSNMMRADRELIAANIDMDANYLKNWLHCFSVLRNTCAHYNRIYWNTLNPPISLDGKILREYSDMKRDTLFAYIVAMLRMMPEKNRKARMINALKTLFEEYSDAIELSAIGFVENWEELLTEKNITLKPVAECKKKVAKSSGKI